MPEKEGLGLIKTFKMEHGRAAFRNVDSKVFHFLTGTRQAESAAVTAMPPAPFSGSIAWVNSARAVRPDEANRFSKSTVSKLWRLTEDGARLKAEDTGTSREAMRIFFKEGPDWNGELNFPWLQLQRLEGEPPSHTLAALALHLAVLASRLLHIACLTFR